MVRFGKYDGVTLAPNCTRVGTNSRHQPEASITIQSDATSNFDVLSLAGSLKRERALIGMLGADMMQGHDAELCIAAGAVDSVDVVAATASRMRIARHLRLHPKGRVSIWLPSNQQVAAKYVDMLDPLPKRVSVFDQPVTSAPVHYTLLPATPIPDSESAQLAGEFVFEACRKAHISRRRSGYITAAVMELADNAVIHAADGLDPAVVAVNSFGRERSVEVAVTDSGTAIAEAKNPAEQLRNFPGRAIAGETGFLAQILRRGSQAGVNVAVEVIAGTARLRWTHTSHSTLKRRYVPGMTVIARIGA